MAGLLLGMTDGMRRTEGDVASGTVMGCHLPTCPIQCQTWSCADSTCRLICCRAAQHATVGDETMDSIGGKGDGEGTLGAGDGVGYRILLCTMWADGVPTSNLIWLQVTLATRHPVRVRGMEGKGEREGMGETGNG